ncbi:MAG: glutamate-ammonia-ligase adenylyltransferase [Planctomycetota bacterium]|nr:MAG: glutamate-ammonia-ligase adenylyltransferase [Planctomycetota bacterium]
MSPTATTFTQLIDSRRKGELGKSAAECELERLGLTPGSSALSTLDDLVAHTAPDVDLAELLSGCAASADPGRALANAGRLLGLTDRPSCPVSLADLARFLGASQHMGDMLLQRPELLAELGTPFDATAAAARYERAGAGPDAERALRLAQQADLLAIAWHDLIDGLDVEQVTILVSRLADAVVSGAALGLDAPRHFAILALGKLGGMELNYSSDIDLVFVRPDSASDQAAADHVARRLVKRLGRQTELGHLYRVDMRLRPEGAAGTLTRTLSSTLQYYRERGRPWERQMLIKGRVLIDSGDTGEKLLQGTRQWILECGLDAGAIRQFKRLKAASEARAGSLSGDRTDVKHAPGGIRDIETIVQFLSLQHAASNPWLLCNSTLHGLERLRVAGALESLEAARLRRAYLFHRRVENLLQVMHRVQTHRLPADLVPLARLLGQRDAAGLRTTLEEHRARVRASFEQHFAQAFPATEGAAARLSAVLLAPEPDTAQLQAELEELAYPDPAAACSVLLRASSPVSRFLPSSPRLISAFASVAPILLERLALSAEPVAALDRFERMTRGVGAREVLYQQLLAEPALLEMLCELAAGSAYLADELTRAPQLFDAFVDALLTGVRGRRRRREDLSQLDGASADPWQALADYKRLETLRVGVRDLLDAAPTRTLLSELSQLCIDVLRASFELVLTRCVDELGEPFTLKGVSAQVPAGMVVVALGKVGGLEANYGSDADVLFVHGGEGHTDRGVANSVFFARVAQDFIGHLSGKKGTPRLYKIDARLRPEGVKGPLVTSLRAFEQYYGSSRAALFEHQALLKARIVAGDAALGQRVLALIRQRVRALTLPDDLPARMQEMREKIAAKAQDHDLKRKRGGMVDIEQLTQYLQLVHAREHPAVLVQETPAALERLADHGLLREEEAHWLRDTYLFFRRVEMRLQIALGLDTKEVPEGGKPLRTLALRMGYTDTTEGEAGHLLLNDIEDATLSTRVRYERIVR